ncbi:hypothetical protein J6590_063023 [Homalodisca vitripennis]|nr:hypothetical protein J6590_063023 [Homalodisca vitripennis]
MVSREKIANLIADWQVLICRLEVLQADMQCLRGKVQHIRSRAHLRRTSAPSQLPDFGTVCG